MRALFSWILPISALSALSCSCATVDSRRDVEESAGIAAARVEVGIDLDRAWETDWSTPPAIDPTRPLRLEDVLAEAVRSDRSVRLALTSILSARAALVRAETPPNPVLDFSLGFPLEAEASRMIGLAVMQQLAWLGGRSARIAAEEARLRAAVLDAADQTVRTAIALRGAFATVVALEAMCELRREAGALSESLAGRIDRDIVAGLRPESDRRGARVRLARAVRMESETAEDLNAARLALATSVGAPAWGAAWTTDGTWPEPRDVEGSDEALATARLDVLAAHARLIAGAADVESAGGSRIESFALGVDVTREMSGDWAVGPALSLDVPLFDAGSIRLATAVAALEAARLSANTAQLAAHQEVAALRIEIQAARERRELSSEPLARTLAEEVARIEAGVAAGTHTRFDAELMRLERVEAETILVADRLEELLARLALERSARPDLAAPRLAGDRP